MSPDDGGPWLHGYAVRGIGSLLAEEPIRVGPLRRVNFLVGRNNHGKSTLMRAAAHWGDKPPDPKGLSLASLVNVDRGKLDSVYRRCSQDGEVNIQRGLNDGRFVELGDSSIGVWLPHGIGQLRPSNDDWKEVLRLTNYRVVVKEHVGDPPISVDRVVAIPAFRQLRPPRNDGKNSIESGEGLVKLLHSWERPRNPGTPSYISAQERWAKLRSFLKDVLEDRGADLEVAEGGEDLHIRLSQHGAMLHVDSLGDGIKQVLMLAAACVHFNESLICVEEPEIHLHAGLQRKLIRFLGAETSNQYLIATHSAHVLDTPDASIFHVVHDGASTTVTSMMNSSDAHRICSDLGYLASDLLQANYTIWVEGPSDRIYWRHWLSLIDPELAEGVHFSIMVFGGRLVENVHLYDDAPELQHDLIQLVRLGRACSVIIDSDMSGPTSELQQTAKRLHEEAESSHGAEVVVCEWVRTIENLVPRDLLVAAVTELHPIAGKRLRKHCEPFEQPFAGMRKGSFSKTKVAEAVVATFGIDHLDNSLVGAVEALADRVRWANGFPTLAEARRGDG